MSFAWVPEPDRSDETWMARMDRVAAAQDARMPKWKQEKSGFASVGEVLKRFGSQHPFAETSPLEQETNAAIEAYTAKYEPFRPQITQSVCSEIARGMSKLESPIEELIFPWLVAQEYSNFAYNPCVLFAGENEKYRDRTVCVIPQLKIGNYRADFALAASRGGPIMFVMVECDGAEFHDGVKNVRKDVDRDVKILSNARVLEVVRISGAEIRRSPKDAAKTVERALINCWRVGNPEYANKFQRRPA